MAENLLSKVKIGSTVYDLKDADSRTKLTTLIGSNELQALGTAAWRAVAAQISDGDGKIADAATVKTYVDAQVGSIKTFDVVVCEAVAAKIPAGAEYKDGETVIIGTMPASADTMKKLYMVKHSKAGAGSYTEWISIDKGESASPRYVWECIGSTEVDLSDYVKKTQKIAGIALNGDISVADLQNALGLKQLAYKDKADVVASYNGATVKDVKATYTPAGTITLNDLTQTSTAASLTKAAYTPAGSITGDAIKGGSINVTIVDASSATAVTDVEYEAYQPAGSVALAADNNGSFQPAGTNAASVVTINKTNDTFVKSLKSGSVDAASFTEGTFTPNTPTAIDTSKFNGGVAATFTQGAKAALSTSNISYVESGVEVAVDQTDAEMLVFTNVTAKSAKAVDTFTANGDDSFVPNTVASLESGFYTAGTAASKAADTFAAQKLPEVDGTGSAIASIESAEAAAQVFTGNKYAPSFTGTSADIKFKGAKYLKQEIGEKTFTPEAAVLGFAGTEVADFQVTGVNYDKATANGASFSGTAGEASVGDIVVPSAKLDIEDKAA